MAVRILTYVGLLYQDLAKQTPWRQQKRLPPVLPIVLYNGKTRWRAKQNIGKLLVEESPESLQVYLPHTHYLLLDEGATDERDAYQLKNLAAATLLEAHTMLAETLDSWTRQWKQEGLQEGESLILQQQLTKRFGPLPESVLQCLQEATLAEPENWGERVLDARGLQEVFDDAKRPPAD